MVILCQPLTEVYSSNILPSLGSDWMEDSDQNSTRREHDRFDKTPRITKLSKHIPWSRFWNIGRPANKNRRCQLLQLSNELSADHITAYLNRMIALFFRGYTSVVMSNADLLTISELLLASWQLLASLKHRIGYDNIKLDSRLSFDYLQQRTLEVSKMDGSLRAVLVGGLDGGSYLENVGPIAVDPIQR